MTTILALDKLLPVKISAINCTICHAIFTLTRSYSAGMWSSWNGKNPFNSTYSSTPMLQASTYSFHQLHTCAHARTHYVRQESVTHFKHIAMIYLELVLTIRNFIYTLWCNCHACDCNHACIIFRLLNVICTIVVLLWLLMWL